MIYDLKLPVWFPVKYKAMIIKKNQIFVFLHINTEKGMYLMLKKITFTFVLRINWLIIC